MSKVLGSIFGFGDKMKRRLRDAISNPTDYLEMTADENQNEWRKNPDERSMGFFNPVPLGKIDPFLLRKQMKEAIDEISSLSRRDFMKKSAGLAAGSTVGAGVTAKLLRKFAPEEKQIAKEVAAEVAPKYKYNSLKEYLDDVDASANSWVDSFYNQYGDEGMSKSLRSDMIRGRLVADELKYNNAKSGQKLWDVVKGDEETLNAFSPQAKKEMKLLKDKSISLDRSYGGTEPEHQVWTDWLINSKGDLDSTLKTLQELK